MNKCKLERDIERCTWFSLQCDKSVDLSSTAQLAVFIRMVFGFTLDLLRIARMTQIFLLF